MKSGFLFAIGIALAILVLGLAVVAFFASGLGLFEMLSSSHR